MVKLKIKYFGPILEGCKKGSGFFEINNCTVLIGEQGSGKSTIAKLFSLFSWLEKDFIKTNSDKQFNFNSFVFDDFYRFML